MQPALELSASKLRLAMIAQTARITMRELTLPDRSRIASFDVDAQYTFTPVCANELPVPGGDEIAAALNAQAERASIRVGSKDAHSPHAHWLSTDQQPTYSRIEAANMDMRWPLHAIVGTRGFELLDGLPRPVDYDFFVWKGIEPDMHPYGACYHDLADTRSTGVIEFLQARGVECVLVGGLATDYCVKTTALQLRRAGFRVVVNLRACRGIAADTIAAAHIEMQHAGIELVELES
jgi:nicotinamidase/pyrazinamidase